MAWPPSASHKKSERLALAALVGTYCGTKAPGFPEDYVFGNAQYPVTGLTSRYQALQLQFQRRTSHGLQIFAAYSWAHSVDDAPIYRGSAAAYSLIRGDSDVDRRHVLRVGATYSQPRITGMRLACRLFNGWSTALNIAVQSGTPFSINPGSMLLVLPDGEQVTRPANKNTGVSARIRNVTAPGGWQLNPAAFNEPAPDVVGTAGRNTFREFAAGQADVALTKEFSLTEHARVHLRAEIFNTTNHPSSSNFDSAGRHRQRGRISGRHRTCSENRLAN